MKYELLEVSSGPVVNEPAAIEMAEGVQRLLGADVGLSLTGVAGPTEQDGVPVGTVCIGIALPTGSHATTVRLGSLREQVRQFAVINALDLLRRRLELSEATVDRRADPSNCSRAARHACSADRARTVDDLRRGGGAVERSRQDSNLRTAD